MLLLFFISDIRFHTVYFLFHALHAVLVLQNFQNCLVRKELIYIKCAPSVILQA